MADVWNFVFLHACIILLSIGLIIAGGRISELEGKVDSLHISLNKKEDNNDQKK